ncbi:helix-turn-helix transcriptional regulator [Superficieibacter sp.]|uniref:helix-turn-helix domain-containing protein n=1 Tax=Superficieibacter sp. TaxID=2303322 RepID=UPI0028AC1E1D|nr:helix-turn-helix transcriptional regulator [Superficieibacter sp.]
MSSIYSDEYQLVIKILRNARRERGLTQAAVASQLGKKQSFVAKVEGGERRLDIVEFVHICRLLAIDPCVILNEMK